MPEVTFVSPSHAQASNPAPSRPSQPRVAKELVLPPGRRCSARPRCPAASSSSQKSWNIWDRRTRARPPRRGRGQREAQAAKAGRGRRRVKEMKRRATGDNQDALIVARLQKPQCAFARESASRGGAQREDGGGTRSSAARGGAETTWDVCGPRRTKPQGRRPGAGSAVRGGRRGRRGRAAPPPLKGGAARQAHDDRQRREQDPSGYVHVPRLGAPACFAGAQRAAAAVTIAGPVAAAAWR